MQLTASQQGVTKASGLSNTLQVQKGQRAEKGDTVTYIRTEEMYIMRSSTCFKSYYSNSYLASWFNVLALKLSYGSCTGSRINPRHF